MAFIIKVWTFWFLLVILDSFSQGQKYFFGQQNTEEFYTEPSLPYYHQPPSSFQNENYYLPKDLETSDLPPHLRKSLPQYQQNFDEIPIPFRFSKDYVKPSTHRPDYSHLLPQRYQPEILNTKVDYYRAPKIFTNTKSDNINPVTNTNKNNQLDLNLTKRDSAEYVAEDEEYDEEDQNVDKLNEKGNNNELEYEEEYEYEDEDDTKPQQKQTNIKDNNDFVDVDLMETTTKEPATSQLPQPKNNEEKHFPELVVSVVTSKTIVNNTITLTPQNVSSTESSVSLPQENSTDAWIVIASVQTSRSISGARYIPSSIVDQDERIQLLNEPTVTEPITEVVTETEAVTPKIKTSTESLIDKLDRVQSDLSSGLLTGGYKNDNIAVIEENLSTKLETTTEQISISTSSKAPYPQVNIRKFNPGNRALRPKTNGKAVSTTTPKIALEQAKGNSILQKAKQVDDISALLPPGYKLPSKSTTEASIEAVLKHAKPVIDISVLLPPGYKPPASEKSSEIKNILSNAKPTDNISSLQTPIYKSSTTEKYIKSILSKVNPVPVDDISALLPPGYKPPKSENILTKAKSVEDISALLPPGYKAPKSENDVSALLPPGYNKASPSIEKSANDILSKAVPVDDISALLPPGYRKGYGKGKSTTPASVNLGTVSQNIPANLLPPGFKLNDTITSTSRESPSSTTPITTSTSASGFKIVFPSRPGGGRKTPRLTTPRAQNDENINKPTIPTIQKGWPVRASTEFTGWPTPSTTPISIEKLLEAARAAASSTSTEYLTETSSTTTTTTTTTTTVKPTTPGICVDNCDLAGTIRLVGGIKWVPELLDRNTKEYQILANSVQSELENIYNSSPILKNWYTKIRIDGFSEGSVLVDYLVEFNSIGQKVNTQEIKRFFHESLGILNRESKSLNETTKAERLTLGKFEVDPKYTDFVVIPKHPYPTVGYADDVLLPQWAIAVIVIGLASLLFVIVFGVTVLFNRHKNSKKTPAPLTEDMLNELNKNHMGGFENYDQPDDFYNMEDVWSEKQYEQKPHKKRPNNGSLYDNSTTNLYDSWQSQWNGQWNAYKNHYGNSSQYSGHSGYHRRPEYDTNF